MRSHWPIVGLLLRHLINATRPPYFSPVTPVDLSRSTSPTTGVWGIVRGDPFVTVDTPAIGVVNHFDLFLQRGAAKRGRSGNDEPIRWETAGRTGSDPFSVGGGLEAGEGSCLVGQRITFLLRRNHGLEISLPQGSLPGSES